jgi:hypothetical protein
VGLAVLDDAAAQIGDAAGGDRHEPPFGGVAGIDLDLADCAFELGECDGLAVARLHHLHLAGVDQLRKAMRREVVRLIARIAQDQLVELAGLELDAIWHEHLLAGLAEVDRHLDGLLTGEIAGSVARRRADDGPGQTCDRRLK